MEKKTDNYLTNNIVVPNYLMFYVILNKKYQGIFNNLDRKYINTFQQDETVESIEKSGFYHPIKIEYHDKLYKKVIINEYIDKHSHTICNYKEIIVNKVSYDNDDNDWVIVKN